MYVGTGSDPTQASFPKDFPINLPDELFARLIMIRSLVRAACIISVQRIIRESDSE